MFTKRYWIAVAERAIRGGAIGAGAAIGTAAWVTVDQAVSSVQAGGLGFAFGALTSVLFSLAGGALTGEKGSPSLVSAEVIAKGDHEAG